MHKIELKNRKFYMIDSNKFITYLNIWKKEKIIVLNNEDAIDTSDIKRIVKVGEKEKMIYEVLKNESVFISDKVNDEIKLYNKELTPGIVKNMILKYKTYNNG